MVCQRTKTLKTPFSRVALFLCLRASEGGELRALPRWRRRRPGQAGGELGAVAGRRLQTGRARGGPERGSRQGSTLCHTGVRAGAGGGGCLRGEGTPVADGGRHMRGHAVPTRGDSGCRQSRHTLKTQCSPYTLSPFCRRPGGELRPLGARRRVRGPGGDVDGVGGAAGPPACWRPWGGSQGARSCITMQCGCIHTGP